MINCLAIDDEPLALRQLATYISKVPFLHLVAECGSAIEARRVMDEELIDAIFCDINMPDLNGLDFVRSLSAPPLIVFTTAYADYAIEGYKVDAVDYLLKPFGLDDFRRAANKLLQRMPAATAPSVPATQAAPMMQPGPAAGTATAKEDQAGVMFVKTEGRMVKINVADIVYVEGMSEYLKLHLDATTQDGKPQKPLVVLFSMKAMEERLPSNFMRIHRSYIINLHKIVELNKNRVTLSPDISLPIGDLYKEALSAFVTRNFLGR